MSIFASLKVYHDTSSRSAALNMAFDEALLESAGVPAIRFYRWESPALSFGYFGKFADVASYKRKRDLVRRWTGGGIVFHGGDLTYSIIIPSGDAVFSESSMSIYEKIHGAIRRALRSSGEMAELASRTSPKISDSCFANAVRSDVLLDGRKVAGAAQRRTRRGLLQQGSIQNVEVDSGLATRFAQELGEMLDEQTFNAALIRRAQEIAEQKYGTTAWLQRR